MRTKWEMHGIWRGMHSRCYSPKNMTYSNYGGRGIRVCERWGSFDLFLCDMGFAAKDLTLDRIRSDGDYEPSNCRWADKKTQDENKRSTVWLEHDGTRDTLTGWARRLGFSPAALHYRIKKLNMPTHLALTLPMCKRSTLSALQAIK